MHNKVEILKIKSVSENIWNPNVMKEKDFLGLKRALLEQNGNMSNPILVRKSGSGHEIIDGVHRFKAMQELGFKEIAAIIIEATDADARLKTVAMNKFRGSIDQLKMASLISELQVTYLMTDKEIEEQLGMTDEDVSDANDINAIEELPVDDTEVPEEVANGITLKLDLNEEELDVIYGLAETLGVDVKSLILRAVAESTRYLNEGKEMTKVVSVSEIEEFDIADVNF